MSAVDTLRDALYGNPPSPNWLPSREGTLKAFSDLYAQVNALTIGVLSYDTVANLPGDAPNGSQARVTDDPTAANNTYWIRRDGEWQIDTDLIDSIAVVVQPMINLARAWASANGEPDATNYPGILSAKGYAAQSEQQAIRAEIAAVILESFQYVGGGVVGPGAVVSGSAASAGTIRIDNANLQDAARLSSITFSVATAAGNHTVMIVQKVATGSWKVLGVNAAPRAAGKVKLNASDFTWASGYETFDLPDNWSFACVHATGGSAEYLLSGLASGSSNTVSGTGAPALGSTFAAANNSTTIPRWEAEVQSGNIVDVVKGLDERVAAIENGGGQSTQDISPPDGLIYAQPAPLATVYPDQQRYNDVYNSYVGNATGPTDLGPENNFGWVPVFFNQNVAWPEAVRGTTPYVRQPHAANSKGNNVFFFVTGRMGGGQDDQPSRAIYSLSADLGVTFSGQKDLITSFTTAAGTSYENAVGNLSSGYHEATGRHWLLAKSRHVNSAVSSTPDNTYACYYDFTASVWRGATGNNLATPFGDIDCIDLSSLAPAGSYYYAPPNSAAIVKKVDVTNKTLPVSQRDIIFPMRVQPTRNHGTLQMIRLRRDWQVGEPNPFEVLISLPLLTAVDPANGNSVEMNPGECAGVQLPNGNLYVIARDNGSTGHRLCYIFSPDGSELLDYYYEPVLSGQDMTGSLVVHSGLGDGRPFRMSYTQNLNTEVVDSGSRAGIGARICRRIGADGRPVWNESTGRFFPVTINYLFDILGNPQTGSFTQNNNACATWNASADADDPKLGVLFDNKVRTPSANAQFVVTPRFIVTGGNWGKSVDTL